MNLRQYHDATFSREVVTANIITGSGCSPQDCSSGHTSTQVLNNESPSIDLQDVSILEMPLRAREDCGAGAQCDHSTAIDDK